MLTLLSVLLLPFVNAQDQCDICPAGSFVNTLTGYCTPCQTGYYNPTAGLSYAGAISPNCLQCPIYYGTNLDQSGCVLCPAGKLSSSGVCMDCPYGKYQPNMGVNDTYGNSTECRDCKPGEQPKADQSGCEQCPAGKYSDGTGCIDCPQYSYSKGVGQTADHCSQCGIGHEPNKLLGATDCVRCPRGKYSDDGYECYSCNYGQANEVDGSFDYNDCKQCMAGHEPRKGWVNGAYVVIGDKCEQCTPGHYSNRGQECYQCSEGYINHWGAQNEGDCLSCPLGHRYNDEYTGCTICPAGKYSNDGLYCYDCPPRTIRLTPGATKMEDCIMCAANMSEGYQNAYKCECEDGQYEVANTATPCVQCPLGRTSIKKYYNPLTNMWIGGTVVGASPDGCTPCQPGKYGFIYTDINGVSYGLCTDCSNGQFNPNTGSTTINDCMDCQDGKYSVAPDLANCTTCWAGTYGIPSHTNCAPCNAGEYNPNMGATTSTACVSCTNGQWSMPGASTCRDCPPGTFADSMTMATCRPCDINTFTNGSRGTSIGVCTSCAAGRFNNWEAQAQGHWVPGPWRNCSSDCMTSRDVVCADSLYRRVPDGWCLGSAKPATSAVCDGDPSNQWFGTNANRCARDCWKSPTGNPAKVHICSDGTCVADVNDCSYGNRYVHRKQIMDSTLATLYKTNPMAVHNWVSQVETQIRDGLGGYSSVRITLLTLVTNWMRQPAVEVTFQFEQAPYPLSYFTVSNNRACSLTPIECVTPPSNTMASCMELCQKNSSCYGATYLPGPNDCCLCSTTSSISNPTSMFFRNRFAAYYQDTDSMNQQYLYEIEDAGSNIYSYVPGLDPAWGWAWAAGAPPAAVLTSGSASSSGIKVNKTAGIIAGSVIGGILLLIVLVCLLQSCGGGGGGGGSKPSQEPYKDAVQLQPTNKGKEAAAAESGTVVRNQGQPQQQQQQQNYNNNQQAKQDPNGVWESVVSAEGHVYYVNRLTGESRWDIPAS